MQNLFERTSSGSTQRFISPGFIRGFSTTPPIETQQAIVAEIETEQRLVASNCELIARFEAKIQAALARVSGEEDAEQKVQADEPARQAMS